MLVNAQNLTAVFINLKTIFNKVFEAAPSQWQETTMLVPSGSSQNDYAWLSRFPRMRKWLGDKVIKSGRTTGVTQGVVVRIEVNTRLDYGTGSPAVIGGFEALWK